MKILVEKRTGRKEPFSPGKIMHTMRAAGAGYALMQDVTSGVLSEILGDVRQGVRTVVVPSQKIGRIVAKHLKTRNKRLGLKYQSYKK